jgi:hypothetical protein
MVGKLLKYLVVSVGVSIRQIAISSALCLRYRNRDGSSYS